MNQHGIWSGNRPNPFLVLHLRVLPRSESSWGEYAAKPRQPWAFADTRRGIPTMCLHIMTIDPKSR